MRTLRFADPADAPLLLSIYEPYVTRTCISFEFETPSVGEFADRIRAVSSAYPYLICEEDGAAVGYAYAAPYRSRAAYQWDVETSIYLGEDFHGMGAGPSLYRALLSLLAMQGVCNAYACLAGQNERSVRFHLRHGFVKAGVFRSCGFKDGRWHDVVWMEKNLRGDESAPGTIVAPSELDPESVRKILMEAAR